MAFEELKAEWGGSDVPPYFASKNGNSEQGCYDFNDQYDFINELEKNPNMGVWNTGKGIVHFSGDERGVPVQWGSQSHQPTRESVYDNTYFDY